jgi:hypothetical protein
MDVDGDLLIIMTSVTVMVIGLPLARIAEGQRVTTKLLSDRPPVREPRPGA